MADSELLALKCAPLVKRTWCYARPPHHYDIAQHSCGNGDAQWSEFEEHLWCSHCGVDFIPEHDGVLGGPIPIAAATKAGVIFDRVIIKTGKIERFAPERLKWMINQKSAKADSEPRTNISKQHQ